MTNFCNSVRRKVSADTGKPKVPHKLNVHYTKGRKFVYPAVVKRHSRAVIGYNTDGTIDTPSRVLSASTDLPLLMGSATQIHDKNQEAVPFRAKPRTVLSHGGASALPERLVLYMTTALRKLQYLLGSVGVWSAPGGS
ncbi:hypothetical protein NCU06426 [Neurospora crassa OR74A]|uniref:Uncharacterized protein n=1 Tax=Neurospora crassa (strain ATCC 24698 / 74-OR23-1A / CBS 708.71 / DSM 1257 / FGSC 987) TaxID=367110 RepID=Q7RYY9_NEUCR|nr:hypothetical protein NCU06426 [Neurospora crassa OR74A]EAA28081.1 hypothetical protein NCU06426 [Neurospora crassa OR74A]|eukprot:XP_957317.1 hypothetical protein NCU06426 [Neurospora crassa OR74A]